MASNSPVPIDTVDSVRLRSKSRTSIASINWEDANATSPVEAAAMAVNKMTTQLNDLDFNDLDAEIQNINNELKINVNKLRQYPKNEELKRAVREAKERLIQIHTWTSKLNTEDGRLLLAQQKIKEEQEKIEQRKYEIDQVLKTVKAQSEVDICFLMDCTNSMERHVNKVQEDIQILSQTIPNVFQVQPRLAFIGYRDVNNLFPANLKLDFTTDVNQFKQFLEEVQAKGGPNCDICEDVFSGLEDIPTLLWASPNRILVHICDAPCHGRQYYNEQLIKRNSTVWDHFPDGDPKNRDLSKILLNIKELDIKYFSVQLKTENTEKMFNEFRLIYGTIPELNAKNPNELINIVTKTTSSVIMNSIQNTMSIFRTTDKRKIYALSDSKPEWSTIKEQQIVIVEVVMPRQLEDIFQGLLLGKAKGSMQIAAKPFAKGSLRYAYYGKFGSEGSQLIDVVFKELISSDPRYNTVQVYQQHLEIHVIAQFLAAKFNVEQRRIFRNPHEIIYADADIVQQVNDPTKIYQVEGRIYQKIQKWNNNSGGVSMDDYASTLQSFSHWTYHFTRGRLMVVDSQGVKTQENTYLLTDPAIHFQDLSRYREARTNLGVKGMREFFRAHVCTEVCEKLDLEKIQNSIDEETFKRLYKSNDYDLEALQTLTNNTDEPIPSNSE